MLTLKLSKDIIGANGSNTVLSAGFDVFNVSKSKGVLFKDQVDDLPDHRVKNLQLILNHFK